MTVADPTLRLERRMLREGATLIIGADEVGRGAIAGPVAVGMSVFDGHGRRIPTGLRDSKLLSEQRREELHPLVERWSPSRAVGLASNAEIESIGIIAALGLAATRALEVLRSVGVTFRDAVVLLDGSHDWLSPAMQRAGEAAASEVRVVTRVKADRDCAAVAAASVLAKVHRDRMMIDAARTVPVYDWASNKGYASAAHYAAIDEHGPHELHRHSWLRGPTLDIPFDDDESEAFADGGIVAEPGGVGVA